MGFHLGTLHGYFFHQDFWPNLNFPLECQIKLVLIISYDEINFGKCCPQSPLEFLFYLFVNYTLSAVPLI